jgi:hypothetical protein
MSKKEEKRRREYYLYHVIKHKIRRKCNGKG